MAKYDHGGKLLGTCDYPEKIMEAFLEARGIEHDAEPTDNAQFCNGLDDTAMCCEDCNWYTTPDDIGDFGTCSDCEDNEEDF